MKKILIGLTIFTICSIYFSFQQVQNDNNYGVLYYTYTIRFSKNKTHKSLEKVIFNASESVKFTLSDSSKKSVKPEVTQESTNNKFSTTLHVTQVDPVNEEPSKIYINLKKDLVLSHETIGKQRFILKEEASGLDWKFTGAQRKINSYDCEEAITTFKGRTFHAFFTKKIPVNVGPWKLQGLPGLILYAYDESGEVEFTASSIEYPVANQLNSIIPPDTTRYKVISWQEFHKKTKEEMAEREKRMKSVFIGIEGATIKTSTKINRIDKFDE